MLGHRLSEKKWKQIEKLLQNTNRNMSKIAKKFHISRFALYNHAYTKGLLTKQEKRSFWQKIKEWLKIYRNWKISFMTIYSIAMLFYIILFNAQAFKLIFPILVMIGAVCNYLAVAFNEWQMPVYPLFTDEGERAILKEQLHSSMHKVIVKKKEGKLLFLGDIFYGSIFKKQAIFSIGDVFFVTGLIIDVLFAFGFIHLL